MKRIFLMAVIAAVALGATPAPARSTKPKAITFETAAPCGAVCPYWQSLSQPEAFAKACEKDPVTVPGSWDDFKLKVPKTIAGRKPFGVIFSLRPGLEYDGFICTVSNAGKSNERYNFGVASGNQVTQNCDVVFFGCAEKVQFAVRPNQTIVLRAYNWSDGPTCPGTYSWAY